LPASQAALSVNSPADLGQIASNQLKCPVNLSNTDTSSGALSVMTELMITTGSIEPDNFDTDTLGFQYEQTSDRMWLKNRTFISMLVVRKRTVNTDLVLSGEERESMEGTFQCVVDECEKFTERFWAAMA
jgi:hypothetical protein